MNQAGHSVKNTAKNVSLIVLVLLLGILCAANWLAGMNVDQMDLIELNEAFAAQSVYCVRELGLNMDKVNIHGGAIALGHPIGCSGARIVVTLLYALAEPEINGKYGLASLCIGGGQGTAIIVERL